MANSILKCICNTCNCNEEEAQEYLDDEIRNLRDLQSLNDLREGDFETACKNLGLESDYTSFFIEALAS